MVHLVAVIGADGPLPERAQALGAILSRSVAEARQRLVATPSVVARVPGEDAGAALVHQLRDAGFDALTFDPATSPFITGQRSVRRFEFDEGLLRAWTREGEGVEVPLRSIRLILRGTETATEVTEKEVTTKKFNPALAVVTGGVVMRTKKSKTVRSVSDAMAGFVHVYAAEGPPLTFSEFHVDFQGLGALLEKSRMLNMQVLLRALREAATEAKFDDRLMRRSSQAQLLGPGLPPEANLSVASALLAMAVWAAP